MNPVNIVGPSWADVIGDEFGKPYMQRISKIVKYHRTKYHVLPEPKNVMRAFLTTPYDEVKVVILGQDPYPNPEHAMGLAFSCPQGDTDNMIPVPASLKNIFKALENDYGFVLEHNPDLTRWAKQGVLLLNTALTVVAGHPASHAEIGWNQFIRTVISKLNNRPNPIVYLLWGKHAQSYIPFIKGEHEYLTAPHPSPLSAHRGFLECRHFSQCNNILETANHTPINWTSYDHKEG